MNKYALNDHSVTCPACLAEYSKLDSPHEYARVMHVLHLSADQRDRVAQLSAEILAKDKLPGMSKEEEGELRANLELKDLPVEQQNQVDAYLNSVKGMGFKLYPLTIMEHIHGEFLKGQQERQQTTILEQVCLGLRELGVDAKFHPYSITVELVADDCSLLFSHGAVTWEGRGYFAPLAHWVSDVPNSCTDVPRITKAIFGWLKRFDYREYRGNK